MLILHWEMTVSGAELSGTGKRLKGVNIDTPLQIRGKKGHKKLNGVIDVTKSQIGGKKWNSLFYLKLETS